MAVSVSAALKTSCAVAAGAGCVAGGTAIYYKRLPATWRELFVKEGRFLLRDDNHWKAIYHDQKDGSHWTTETSLKGLSDSDSAKTAIRNWCSENLEGKIEAWSGEEFDSRRSRLLNLCTADGIVTVKGKIVQSGKDEWIDEANGDDKYKTIFAVYRYNSEFLRWMNDNGTDGGQNLTQESKIAANYTKLKNLCRDTLRKPYATVEKTTPKILQYAHWWCSPLPYSTIEQKIKAADKDWTLKGSSDDDWKKLAKKWGNTVEVKRWAKTVQDGDDAVATEDDVEEEELTETSLKALCASDQANKQLSEENSYQGKYIVIRDACDGRQDLSGITISEEQQPA